MLKTIGVTILAVIVALYVWGWIKGYLPGASA